MALDLAEIAEAHLQNGRNIAVIGRTLQDARKLAAHIGRPGLGHVFITSPRQILGGGLRGAQIAYAITDASQDLTDARLIEELKPNFLGTGAPPRIAVYD